MFAAHGDQVVEWGPLPSQCTGLAAGSGAKAEFESGGRGGGGGGAVNT